MEKEFQTQQTETEINLAQIFGLLLSKIKLLLIVLLAGIVGGASFGFFKSYNVHEYGTTITFYINPKTSSVVDNNSQYGVYGAYSKYAMDNIVKLLESENFLEKLMLDESGIPTTGISDEQYAAIVTAKENEANALTVFTQAKETLKLAIENTQETTKAYEYAQQVYQEAWTEYSKSLEYYLESETGGLSAEKRQEWYDIVEDRKIKWQDAETMRTETKTAMDEAISAEKEAETALAEAENWANFYKEETLKVTGFALTDWRASTEYKKLLELVKDSISYSYIQKTDDKEDASDLARSFIYIELSVRNNEELAKTLLERIKIIVPQYVEENMTVPSGYDGTRCQQITIIDEIVDLDPNHMINQIFLYGAIVGIIAVLIACFVLIVLDNTNRQLRDLDTIAQKFNLPVLGVIPTLDESLYTEANIRKPAKEQKGEQA